MYQNIDEIIQAFAAEKIDRSELEWLMNSPCYGLTHFEYVDALLAADNAKYELAGAS